MGYKGNNIWIYTPPLFSYRNSIIDLVSRNIFDLANDLAAI